MRKHEIIKDESLYSNIIHNGRYLKTKCYTLYYLDNNENKTKFGLAISKHIGNAVVRNKLKRQTRMIIDNNKKGFKNNKDYIIMIKKPCLDESFVNKEKELITILKEIK